MTTLPPISPLVLGEALLLICEDAGAVGFENMLASTSMISLSELAPVGPLYVRLTVSLDEVKPGPVVEMWVTTVIEKLPTVLLNVRKPEPSGADRPLWVTLAVTVPPLETSVARMMKSARA